jgi:ATP/maltotriose-dependent transcriptional regulator MalT
MQLAALSLQGREDVSAFIAGFAGDDRYIVDCLAEEVLARQPEFKMRLTWIFCPRFNKAATWF